MIKVYSYLLDPTQYPDYSRRSVKVPTWKTFNDRPQFICLRMFSQRGQKLILYREDIELYTKLNLGRVFWPTLHTVHADNFKDLVTEIERRNVFLFDIWGHVPGSPLEGFWSHITPPLGIVEYLQKELGDHFLGIDNGEQDGRYVGGYANQQCPSSSDHRKQYLNFHRHFEQMGNELGNCLTTLVSLSYGHYFLKEGNHLLIGAETAQALPNSQVYYAFIRGAGKQYGIHWFGNASVWNRWGCKIYESEDTVDAGPSAGFPMGPEQGASLALLKRLMFSHYLYNCVALGFEQSYLYGDNIEKRIVGLPVPMESDRSTARLTPLGEIQVKCNELVERYGQPGVMHTPVALLLDFFAGWTVPRHFYTNRVYQVWGTVPYGIGDYFTHALFSMLYPGYEDASFYRDERGFSCATPFGDCADVLLSDVAGWVMQQYPVIVAAGELSGGKELADKLRTYIESGGHLVITAANAMRLFSEIRISAELLMFPSGSTVLVNGKPVVEPHEFQLHTCQAPAGSKILASCRETPAVLQWSWGQGKITLLLTSFGFISRRLTNDLLENRIDSIFIRNNDVTECEKDVLKEEGVHRRLNQIYKLTEHTRVILSDLIDSQQLFSIDDRLGLITCRKGPGQYTLGVHNNQLAPLPLKIESHCGQIKAIRELELGSSEKKARGYKPTTFENVDLGISDEHTIAGGDIRLFEVGVDEHGITCLPVTQPPVMPNGSFLHLRGATSIKEEILLRPTFFQHFDGVMINWCYLRDRDDVIVTRERGWIDRQKLRIVVDFSSGLNFYPGLTLLDTLTSRYEETVKLMDDVFLKMERLGSKNAIFTLHRKPDNHCDDARAEDRFLAGVKNLCERAGQRGITLHLQHHPHKWHGTAEKMLAFIAQAGAENLKFCLNSCHSWMLGENPRSVIEKAGSRLGIILLSTPTKDDFGQFYDTHRPLAGTGYDMGWLTYRPEVPRVLAGDYTNSDEEYADWFLISKSDKQSVKDIR